MTKKDYVFKVLDKVMWKRSKAAQIKKYLTNNVDDAYVDYLYDQFVDAVNETLKSEWEDKIKNLAQILDKVHQEEAESRKVDEQDIANLENLINTI